jgi:hypothetical protein
VWVKVANIIAGGEKPPTSVILRTRFIEFVYISKSREGKYRKEKTVV